MHIVNIMLSADAGGIQQSFVDYTEGLLARGHKVTAITHPRALVNNALKALNVRPITLRNMGEWDTLAMLRMRYAIQKLNADIAIAHTGRSFALATPSTAQLCPLVGVAHNYNPRVARMKTANGVFAVTHDIARHMAELGIAEGNIHHIPNMVRCNELPLRGKRNNPFVIGAMGRFVHKKGFHIFIEALRILKERGYYFKAVLAGGGDEEKVLKAQAKQAGLNYQLSFPGWVHNKAEFYTKLDVFCLPSLHEPFGIVLLESFTFGAPVIATDTEGPTDIITPNFDALMVEKGNAEHLADALVRLMDDPELAMRLAANSFVKVKTNFALDVVAKRVEEALSNITTNWNRQRSS